MQPPTPALAPGVILALLAVPLLLLFLGLTWLIARLRQGNLRESLQRLGGAIRRESTLLTRFSSPPVEVKAHHEELRRLVESATQAQLAQYEAAPEPAEVATPARHWHTLVIDAPARTAARESEAEGSPPPPATVDTWLANVLAPDAGAPTIALSAVAAADNIAIVGPKGSRKTTLMRSIMATRDGMRLVFDPDNSPGKWPCVTIGGGSNYLAIAGVFAKLHDELLKRSRQLDAGEVKEGDFPRRTLASDEFWDLTDELKRLAKAQKNPALEIGTLLLKRIVKGRKYAECAIVVTHNDTLTGLGLPDGAADMKLCFDYFIYTGGMVSLRCTDQAVLDAALAMDMPMVAYHCERDQWYVLDCDIRMWQKDDLFPQPEPVKNGAETPSKTDGKMSNEAETFSPDLTAFSAAERHLAFSDLPFSVAEIAKIAAHIARENRMTPVIKAMPGYASRDHAIYSDYYRLIKTEIGNIGECENV